ncbi:MAG TPA: flagellar hook-basal body complex protein FliE [Rhizomicrobium sp.]|nr:flagellar hook-basal body complex protein FliE [Rhizomicrobium sp.]
MAVLPAAAAAAYQAVAKMGVSATPTPGVVPADAPGGFGEFLTDALKNSVQTIKQGETMATQHLAGKADIIDVVNAVNSAELTLDTVVAVRDKVVAAYQSIMNMPI